MAPAFDPTKHQKTVKCSGKILKYTAYVLILLGVLNVVCNIIFAFCVSGFSEFNFIDLDGQTITMHLACSGLFMCAIFKIVTGALAIKAGKCALHVFKPILKQYQDAENGVTNGISMTSRQSKKMHWLLHVTWKLFKAGLCVMLVAIVFSAYWLCEQAD